MFELREVFVAGDGVVSIDRFRYVGCPVWLALQEQRGQAQVDAILGCIHWCSLGIYLACVWFTRFLSCIVMVFAVGCSSLTFFCHLKYPPVLSDRVAAWTSAVLSDAPRAAPVPVWFSWTCVQQGGQHCLAQHVYTMLPL